MGALIFGSDQGLVGRFNEIIANFAMQALQPLSGPKTFWIVGERVALHLEASNITTRRAYALPGSVAAITSLVSEIQLELEAYTAGAPTAAVHIFHNRPVSAARYEPVTERLLPLDDSWRRRLAGIRWPRARSAEVLGGAPTNFPALVHEHLFIRLYKACAESLASENASRLEAMQRGEKYRRYFLHFASVPQPPATEHDRCGAVRRRVRIQCPRRWALITSLKSAPGSGAPGV